MSVKLWPAFVERCTARPLDGGCEVKISEYCMAPPIQTSSGRPGGEATYMSYQHCVPIRALPQKFVDANPGVPGVGLDSWSQPEASSTAPGTSALSARSRSAALTEMEPRPAYTRVCPALVVSEMLLRSPAPNRAARTRWKAASPSSRGERR